MVLSRTAATWLLSPKALLALDSEVFELNDADKVATLTPNLVNVFFFSLPKPIVFGFLQIVK